MVLRLVTGDFKGKVLASSDTAKELRPTQAIVREAIINTLKSSFMAEDFENYSDFSDLNILDLYSGSGSMGFEFLSNGAASINFVDYDAKCLRLLKENTQKLACQERVSITRGKLPEILSRIKKENFFDLVFFDPPFKFSSDKYLKTLESVLVNKLLKTGAIMLFEYKNDELEKALKDRFSEHLQLLKTKKYGDCYIHFASRKLPNTKKN